MDEPERDDYTPTADAADEYLREQVDGQSGSAPASDVDPFALLWQASDRDDDFITRAHVAIRLRKARTSDNEPDYIEVTLYDVPPMRPREEYIVGPKGLEAVYFRRYPTITRIPLVQDAFPAGSTTDERALLKVHYALQLADFLNATLR